jgi:hypothetical protein
MPVEAHLADGRVLQFPDGTDPAVVQRTVKSVLGKAAPAPEIDTETGAPAGIRTAVGAAVSDKDRLATIQKSFPDAKPHEGNNFVYTNPETGRPTLYNPPGLDWGDAASLLPEIGEFAGGVVAGAGAIAATPATGGASLLTVPLAVGAGATAGRELAEQSAKWIGGTVDTRSAPERATDQATTFGLNAVAGPVAETAMRGVRHIIGPSSNRQVAAAFERLDVPKMAGAASGSKMIQSMEHGAFNSPGGESTMNRAFEATQEGVDQAAKTVARDIANASSGGAPVVGGKTVASTEGAGNVLKKGVSEAGERFAANRQVLDDGVTAAVGPTRPTQLTHVQALLTDLQAELARAPNSRPDLKRAITEAERMLADAQANGGALPFDVVRKIRTRIGRELEQPDASGYLPGEDAHISRLYGALKDDVYGAAQAADAARWAPGQPPPPLDQFAVYQLERHDRYVRMFRGDKGGRVPPVETFNKVLDAGSDAKAFRFALEGSEQSTQRLWQLRRSLKPEEWDVVAASVFENLGRAKPGAQGGSMLDDVSNEFSVATFLTNWERLGAGTAGRTSRDVLFGGSQFGHVKGAINDLVTVTKALKESSRLANTSGTARSTAWNSLFAAIGTGALGAVGTGSVAGTLGAAAGGAAAHVATGYGSARLLTSPRFVRWLTTSAKAIGRNPNGVIPALTRLEAIAEAEPDLRQEIQGYRLRLEHELAGASAPAP